MKNPWEVYKKMGETTALLFKTMEIKLRRKRLGING
jgi:hypothetical protein